MKKVLIITYYWPPSGGAGVQRWVKFVKYLPEYGIEPIVLTVDPEYASYPVTDESLSKELPEDLKVFYTKSNEPFNYYKKVSGKSDIPHAGFANESDAGLIQKTSRFIRGNFFIPDARKGWNKYAYNKAIKLIEKYNIDTVITTSPPHSSQLIGLKLKTNFKINWFADLRDPWTDIYYYKQMYHTPMAKRIDLEYEKDVLINADKVIVVSEAIKKQFLSKSKDISQSKFSILPNGFDEADFEGHEIEKTNQFIITYTGTIAANYNIELFLKAVFKLKEEVKENMLILRFVGVVSDNFKNLIQSTSLNEVTEFVGHVEHAKSIRYLLSSTVLFLAIPDVEDNEGILTGKLFEYLGAQKPILGIGPVDGDAARIITHCKAGVMIDYYNQDKIFEYLWNKYRLWQRGDKQNLEEDMIANYSRKSLTIELVNLINN